MPNNDNCRFCDLSLHAVMDTNEHAVSFLDAWPVTEFHTLFIPRRHVLTYFDLTEEESQSIHKLIMKQRKRILDQDPSIEGFNVGWNCGKAAGQSVFHAHCHLIARKEGEKIQRKISEPPSFLHPWVDELGILQK
jgi:diadenosine tetraphosphate (Ap4A) HIT family hydrolase|tara:strand:- start:885 stop:1289 length:405 start_codon:yes stop_codon:yes gene_type:complete